MSFSSTVKEELSRQLSGGRHCQIAEIAAIISMCGRIQISEYDKYKVKIHTENLCVARKYFTLIKKTYNIMQKATKPTIITVLINNLIIESIKFLITNLLF